MEANVIVISTRASLKILDNQNNVILAMINPTNGPPIATRKKYTTISPPVNDKKFNNIRLLVINAQKAI